MPEDLIRYDVLTSEALRGIIRTVLLRVQKRGLPGEHHFFVNFSTTAPGVIVSKRLKEQYPDEMTIVLQHKFWDLMVHDDRFEVRLSFNNVPERLVIPYAAIKNFVDPSVPYGLNPNQFAPAEGAHRATPPLIDNGAETLDSETPVSAPSSLHPTGADNSQTQDDTVGPDENTAAKGAKVVALDLFRKK